VSEWHFDKHEDGWKWRCTIGVGAVESTQRFRDFVGAIADATLHGYVSGKSRIASIGPPVARGGDAARKPPNSTKTPEAALVIRRSLHMRWIWELRAPDGDVVNRSDADFTTRADCEADAAQHGLTP